MTHRRKPTDAQIVAAIESSGGIILVAAQKLGVNRQSLHRRITKSPRLVRAVQETRESVLDLAESGLIKALGKGESWAVCFTLKCLGKHRGFVERAEVTGADGGPVRVSGVESLSDAELEAIARGGE